MIRYAITHRDRLAYRLACLALRLATPSYRAFVMTCSQRGVRDLYLNPPTPEDVQLIDGPGCTDACSEMHTFEPPCEQAIGDRSDGGGFGSQGPSDEAQQRPLRGSMPSPATDHSDGDPRG